MYNPKYEINAKNKGNVPTPTDERFRTIKLNCGWCKECRKELATTWQIRLTEEYKSNQNAEFVTLSFAPKEIAELEKEIHRTKYKGIEGDDIDVNILAAFALRRFSERWRKENKKTPRYWMITELGHKNTERIHLHGIVWQKENENVKEQVEKHWKYGNIFIGQWVNEQTINYITKYITKLDNQHKGYKQRIFCSKGIGKEYIERNGYIHLYNGEDTITTYRDKQGYKKKMPRYYVQKLWTEEEREKLWQIQLDKKITYIEKQKFTLENQDDLKYRERYLNTLKTTRRLNEENGFGNNETINRKYIITDIMKKEKSELTKSEIQNTVKCKERREIKEYIEYPAGYEHKEELNKSIYIGTTILGEYIGTTTETERKRNREMKEAEKLKISVKMLRLKKKGII